MTGAIAALEAVVGDEGAVRAVAGELRRRAGALTDEAGRLSALSDCEWQGAAAVSFTGLALVLPEELRRSAAAAVTASVVLERYADAVASARAALPGLRDRAAAASARYARSRPLDPGPVADPFGPPDPAVVLAEREREAARADMDAVARTAERVAGAVEDAGRAAARALGDARDLLPLPTPLPTRAVRAAASVADAAWEEVKAFAVEHDDEIQVAADVLAVTGTAALALSVVCPPLAVVAAGTRVAGAAAGLAAAAGGGTAAGLTAASALTNAGVVASSEEKTVRDLWPDLLAVGTLGASRALTAPARFAPRGSTFTVAQARAADSRLPALSGATRPSTWPSRGAAPHDLPSLWDPTTGIGPNELLVRSVKLAVETPNAVVGTAGGLAAGRRLRERAGGRAADARDPSTGAGATRARHPERRTP